MRDGFVSQKCQTVGNSNTIITAQSGALGINTTAIMGDVQTVHIHIQRAVCILFANHVHMALEDHRGMAFHAAGTFTEENDVIIFILNILQVMLLRKGNQIIRDHLGVLGSVGDGTDFFKIAEYGCRLKASQLDSIHSNRSLSKSMGLVYHITRKKSTQIEREIPKDIR